MMLQEDAVAAVLAPDDPEPAGADRLVKALGLSLATAILAACGGGGGGSAGPAANAPASDPANPTQNGIPDGTTGPSSSSVALKSVPLPANEQPSLIDVARFLTQATFGATSTAEMTAVQQAGFAGWLRHQFSLGTFSHLRYLEIRREARQAELDAKAMAGQSVNAEGIPSQPAMRQVAYVEDEWSYEAIWQQWLFDAGQLRARMSFALSQIMVISNVAPDIPPLAMSSYMDMLNRNAFGNYRKLLEDVTLHPAMGYYLNMLESEKANADEGTHPNENYAREVLQLFSIGLVMLNLDGSVQRDANGQPIPTYDESTVKAFARAFSGWSFGGRDTTKPSMFSGGTDNWTVPMQAWPSKHDTDAKTLLRGQTISGGQSPQKDLADALDNIFVHPNVGPFIGRRLIQRFVTSNPSPAYIARVATVFNDNGAGVRGDLSAVISAVLLDPEARAPAATPAAGKQREPVIRFANYLRAFGARSKNGRNAIHYLDSADNAIGQSPLLSPSVFNFFSPDFRNPGAIASAGLVSPEFQITTETTVVGALNFFSRLVRDRGYGWDTSRLELQFKPLIDEAGTMTTLLDWANLMLAGGQLSSSTRKVLATMLRAIPADHEWARWERVKALFTLMAVTPDFVVQR